MFSELFSLMFRRSYGRLLFDFDGFGEIVSLTGFSASWFAFESDDPFLSFVINFLDGLDSILPDELPEVD